MVNTAEPTETIVDVDRTPMLGREPAARDCGVDEGDGMECRDLQLQQTYFYCEEVIQCNENENENIPSAQKLLLEGEWTACASSEMTDLERDADTSNELTEPLTMTIEPDDADGGGVPSVYLGGTCWHAGNVSCPEGQSDGLGCQMDGPNGQADGSRGSADALNALNRAETEVIGRAGTYLSVGDAKCLVKETDGVGCHMDASTGQTDAPSVETNAIKPENDPETISIPRKKVKPQNPPNGPENGTPEPIIRWKRVSVNDVDVYLPWDAPVEVPS